jgi:hypothetical protein
LTGRDVDDTHPLNSISEGTRPRKNFVVNGNFDIWQRGASFGSPATNSFCADHWMYPGSGVVVTRQQVDGILEGSLYAARFVGTNTVNANMVNRIESADAAKLALRTCTVSCYARSLSGTFPLSMLISVPTTYDNYSSSNYVVVGDSHNLTSIWAKYKWTFTLSDQAKYGVQILLYRAGDGSSSTELAQVQLEIGSIATDFELESIGQTLAKCQRYYVYLPEKVYASLATYSSIDYKAKLIISKSLPVTMIRPPSEISRTFTGTFAVATTVVSPQSIAYLGTEDSVPLSTPPYMSDLKAEAEIY